MESAEGSFLALTIERLRQIEKWRAVDNGVRNAIEHRMAAGAEVAEARQRELSGRWSEKRKANHVAEEPEIGEALCQCNFVRRQRFVERPGVEQRGHFFA